ncbi:MAG: sigma-70 family RNA polymerase sigma factor [Acidobacteriota bacterium]
MRSVNTAISQNNRADQTLVRRILAGDEDAFRGFFDQHVRGLYRFVLPRVDRDAETTQEIVQSTLVKAVQSLESFRGEGTLSSWLYSICRFEISAHYRRKMRLPRQEPYDPVAAESLASDADEPEIALGRKEVGQRVHEILDRLPRHYGDALEWKYLEGLSVKQIAARLGMAPKAAESLLTRARKVFRREFERAERAASGEARAAGLRLETER